MSERIITDALIDFALDTRTEDIPAEVIELQKKSLMDSVGVMAAASSMEPACRPFLEYAKENSVAEECTVYGTDLKVSCLMAAMANGALVHALDYEDGHDASKVHPNTASIPVMLALGESMNSSGKDVLAAMAISCEIAIRLKLCLTANDLLDCGWYSPPMFSAYGAVFGAARLMGLTKEQTLDAISICLTQITLPAQSAWSSRSVLRGIRDAFSSRAALFSAIMAKKGVPARMNEPLEGKGGLYETLFRNSYDPEVILGDLGSKWEYPALRYKAWPCCGTTHAVLDTIFSLQENNSIAVQDIEEIHLIINRPHLSLLEPREAKYRPKTLAAAKFSLPFSIALAVRNGNITLNMYSAGIYDDSELLAIADKVTYEQRTPLKNPPAGYFPDDHVEVIFRTAQGEIRKETFVSAGSPYKPLSDRQMEQKFFDCMSHSEKTYSEERLREMYRTIREFDTISGIQDFCKLF